MARCPAESTTPSYTLGRLAEASTDNCSGTLITDEWFSYDKDGDKTDIWEKTPNSGTYYHTQATFYGNGAVNTLKIANPNSYTQTYGLDGEGRPTSLTSSAGPNQVIVSATTYNSASQPTNIAIGTGTDYDGYAYDSNTGRMTSWTFQVGTTPKTETATLTWNPIGTLKSLAITDGFNSGGTQTCNFGSSSPMNMGYDDLNRLVYDDCGSGGWGQTFSYDQYNNLTKAVISGRTGITFNPGYNSANNQYASSFGTTYDSNGNILYDASSTNTYAWNEFSKMKSVNVTGTNCATSGECIVYDAFGRTVEIDSGSTYTEILYSQLGKTVYLNGSTIKYAYWPTPGGGTLLQNPGSFYYEHKDWLGNARLSSSVANEGIIDDRAFAPYGEIYATYGSTAQNENIFTGDTQDIVSGMYDTPNRELVANQGRWMSPDPAQSGWNPYAYATNPNSFVDPSGLQSQPSCFYTGSCGDGGIGSCSSTNTCYSGSSLGACAHGCAGGDFDYDVCISGCDSGAGGTNGASGGTGGSGGTAGGDDGSPTGTTNSSTGSDTPPPGTGTSAAPCGAATCVTVTDTFDPVPFWTWDLLDAQNALATQPGNNGQMPWSNGSPPIFARSPNVDIKCNGAKEIANLTIGGPMVGEDQVVNVSFPTITVSSADDIFLYSKPSPAWGVPGGKIPPYNWSVVFGALNPGVIKWTFNVTSILESPWTTFSLVGRTNVTCGLAPVQ